MRVRARPGSRVRARVRVRVRSRSGAWASGAGAGAGAGQGQGQVRGQSQGQGEGQGQGLGQGAGAGAGAGAAGQGSGLRVRPLCPCPWGPGDYRDPRYDTVQSVLSNHPAWGASHFAGAGAGQAADIRNPIQKASVLNSQDGLVKLLHVKSRTGWSAAMPRYLGLLPTPNTRENGPSPVMVLVLALLALAVLTSLLAVCALRYVQGSSYVEPPAHRLAHRHPQMQDTKIICQRARSLCTGSIILSHALHLAHSHSQEEESALKWSRQFCSSGSDGGSGTSLSCWCCWCPCL